MTRRLMTIMLALIPLMRAAGDIAPFPVQARGIIPEGGVDIRMVREYVVVDLYNDSSVVECRFVLKNEGKAMLINIGFPEMNFYHSRAIAGKVPENFYVFENDTPVALVEAYRPHKQETASIRGEYGAVLSERLFFSPSESSDNKPWLLWDSQFEENEIKIVTVKYTLPYGVVRKDMCRYFNYLLSTGAGWKGEIEHAEIVVNLKDMNYGMVLKASPAGYTVGQNQISWTMADFEPTTDYDIIIYYEQDEGDYERKLALNPDPAWFIDGKMVWNGGMFDDRSLNPVHKLHPDDMLSISIPKGSQKEAYGYESVIIFITKDFAISRFVGRVNTEYPWIKTVRSLPHSDFIKRYRLEIDGVLYEGKDMLEKLHGIEFPEIMKVKAKDSGNGIITIIIRTKKEPDVYE